MAVFERKQQNYEVEDEKLTAEELTFIVYVEL